MTGRIFLVFLAAALVSGCYRKVVRDFQVHVPKLQSEECARLIQEALKPVDGVISATADIPGRTVTVRYDSEKLAHRNIEFVIAGIGFAANDLPLNDQAQGKLPEECR